MTEINKINTNPKPIETVYEIKEDYQILSFEEFMKSYENDEKVNYDDLESGNVGEVEGYGPCSGSCRCNCPRSDCNCESGERYVKVYMPCPADGCGNPTRSNWVHSTDSYYIWISNHANMRCEKSYCSATHKMQNWAFLCSNHSFHNGKHKSASADTWIDVVTTAGKQWGDSDLILELLIYLNTHKSEFKKY